MAMTNGRSVRMVMPDPTTTRSDRATPVPTDETAIPTGAPRQARCRMAPRIAWAALLLAAAAPALAVDVMDPADLPRRVRWRVADVEIEGAGPRRAGELRPLLATRRRSRWTPWKERPRFEREALTNDLARVATFYRERGFYRAEVSAELEVDRDDETVAVVIHIDEREPVVVDEVRGEVAAAPAGRRLHRGTLRRRPRAAARVGARARVRSGQRGETRARRRRGWHRADPLHRHARAARTVRPGHGPRPRAGVTGDRDA